MASTKDNWVMFTRDHCQNAFVLLGSVEESSDQLFAFGEHGNLQMYRKCLLKVTFLPFKKYWIWIWNLIRIPLRLFDSLAHYKIKNKQFFLWLNLQLNCKVNLCVLFRSYFTVLFFSSQETAKDLNRLKKIQFHAKRSRERRKGMKNYYLWILNIYDYWGYI